jgi:hypothetical protein
MHTNPEKQFPSNLISLFTHLCCGMLSLLLVSCGIGNRQATSLNYSYYEGKVIAALGDRNCIVRIEDLFMKWDVIKIKSTGQDDEKRCLKIIQAMSRDPLFPKRNRVGVMAVRVHVTTLRDDDLALLIKEETEQTVFSCGITRDALMKGEKPEVVIRNEIFLYSGQRTPPTTRYTRLWVPPSPPVSL